ncbi:MAG TPA: hypothetical protein VGR72_01555 [Candidatus Acidoferrales bacterium]|nr:hypothetical protein [Candidatus Acidoferrales bacterium]
MNRNIVKILILGAFVVGSIWHVQAQAQDAKSPYPSMAPVEQYMMADRNAEIALARSAAPESVSRDAEVLALGRHGYETAVKGTNGFVCLVERAWNAPFDNPEFWNPKNRSANCYNPPAAKSILPLIVKRAELVLAGEPKDQVLKDIIAFGKKEVPPLEPGAMCIMMSKGSYLTDSGSHNMSHLMFYMPAGTAWGADVPISQVITGEKLVEGTPQPVTLYLIPLRKWSDGTPQ